MAYAAVPTRLLIGGAKVHTWYTVVSYISYSSRSQTCLQRGGLWPGAWRLVTHGVCCRSFFKENQQNATRTFTILLKTLRTRTPNSRLPWVSEHGAAGGGLSPQPAHRTITCTFVPNSTRAPPLLTRACSLEEHENAACGLTCPWEGICGRASGAAAAAVGYCLVYHVRGVLNMLFTAVYILQPVTAP